MGRLKNNPVLVAEFYQREIAILADELSEAKADRDKYKKTLLDVFELIKEYEPKIKISQELLDKLGERSENI